MPVPTHPSGVGMRERVDLTTTGKTMSSCAAFSPAIPSTVWVTGVGMPHLLARCRRLALSVTRSNASNGGTATAAWIRSAS
jgi:hypothetical protein